MSPPSCLPRAPKGASDSSSAIMKPSTTVEPGFWAISAFHAASAASVASAASAASAASGTGGGGGGDGDSAADICCTNRSSNSRAFKSRCTRAVAHSTRSPHPGPSTCSTHE
jgi:hypothetical protein